MLSSRPFIVHNIVFYTDHFLSALFVFKVIFRTDKSMTFKKFVIQKAYVHVNRIAYDHIFYVTHLIRFPVQKHLTILYVHVQPSNVLITT